MTRDRRSRMLAGPAGNEQARVDAPAFGRVGPGHDGQ